MLSRPEKGLYILVKNPDTSLHPSRWCPDRAYREQKIF